MRARLVLPLVLLSILPSARAHAGDRLVVDDIGGARPAADAVTMELRSLLARGRRPAVQRGEMVRTIGVAQIDRAAGGKAALAKLSASHLVTGTVERTGGLTFAWEAYDATMARVSSDKVVQPDGDAAQLALKAAQQLAGRIGADVDEGAMAAPGDLAPYVLAWVARDDHSERTVRRLLLADPSIAARLPAAREAMETLAADTAAAPMIRLAAAIAAGDKKTLHALAHATPTSDLERAVVAWGLVVDRDAAGARKVMKGGPQTAWTAAIEAELLRRQKAAPAAVAQALGPAVSGTADANALSIVAAFPAGALPAVDEGLVVDAARQLVDSEPRLAYRLGLRALDGKVPAGTAMKAIPLDALTTDELAALAAKLGDAPEAQKVQAALKARRPKEAEPAAGLVPEPAAPTPPPAVEEPAPSPAEVQRRCPPDVAHAADRLGALLDGQAALSATSRKVKVLVRPRGELLSPTTVDRELLAAALGCALTRAPHDRVVTDAKVSDGDVGGAPLVVVADAQPDGRSVALRLKLHEASGHDAEAQATVPGFAVGLVRFNYVFFALVLALLAAIAGAAFVTVRRVLHVGELRVTIANTAKLESQREAFALEISRSPTAPGLNDPEAFTRRERAQGPVMKGRHRALAAGTVTFSRVPAGEWYVHLFGTFERNGELCVLPEGLSRPVRIETKGTTQLRYELARDAAVVTVRVVAGRPVKKATVKVAAIDEALRTGSDGQVKVLLPAGDHVLTVEGQGTTVERAITVVGGAAQDVVIDLIQARNAAAGAPSAGEGDGQAAG